MDTKTDPNDLRVSEKELVLIGSENSNYEGIAIYDLRENTQL
jgi:hypothetical protein